MKLVNWSEVREKFPTLTKLIYLNTASMGLLSIDALNAGKKWLEERMIGSLKWMEWYNKSMELKKDIAKLIGAKKEEISLVPNTSTGLNIAANTITWKEGDNIVTNDMEFPANRNIWIVVSKKYGVKIKTAKNKKGEIKIEDYKELIDRKTKAITISWVQYSNGYTHDLEELSELAEEKDIYLIVDGIQGVGSLEINLNKLNISFLAFGGHKWLMGLPGSGFLYINKKILEELDPPLAGWLSSKEPFKFDIKEYEPADDARKFELGSPSFIGYIVVKESIKILNNIGIKWIEKRNKELTTQLIQELKPSRILSPLKKEDEPYSPIISIASKDPEKQLKKLIDKNIIVSQRLGGIRVSLHLYNNEEDVETLIKEINREE